MSQRYKEILGKYIPDISVDSIYEMLRKNNTQLNIKRDRKTKAGDYKPPFGSKKYHRISINHGLNQFHFLITLIHELAHLKVWLNHKNRVTPHGKEWKLEYGNLLNQFINMDVFPKDIESALYKIYLDPKATTYNEDRLLRTLMKYDSKNQKTLLEDLKLNQKFSLPNGQTFIKQEKLRKYYKAKELNTGKIYRVHGMAEVIPQKKPDEN